MAINDPLPEDSSDFTHLRNGQPTMVDVAGKQANKRTAIAGVRVELGADIMARFQTNDLHGPKGPVLQTAIIAGTIAVKKTSDLIPFCHPLPVEHCTFDITHDAMGLTIHCEVTTTGKTGVEMEAMTGASVAALTVYDMCKALNKAIRIEGLHLVSKTGGKSGDYIYQPCMTANRPLYGLVLAGGRSTRMGTDKAALKHPDGRPLARRGVELLSMDCSHAFVSLRHDQDLPPLITESPHVHVVRDPEGESHGPLGGIVAAMRSAPQADWLIIACDLPCLDVATLAHLVSSRQPGETFLCYRSEFDGLPEPLCAYYAAAALPILEQALADGIHCPRKILLQNQCRLLDPIVPGALDNANTPEDWKSATTPL